LNAVLNRTTFTTSRLLDFCSEKELVAQTGHEKSDWPLVILKELVDNALDACEEAGTSPEVIVRVDAGGVFVEDNGPGIPPETVEKVLDYTVRVSSREAYVAPTRGAQGNALKTLVAMPFVLDGNAGRFDVAARGVFHRITFRVDKIRQEPAIDHVRENTNQPEPGTRTWIHWPADPDGQGAGPEELPSEILTSARARFLQMAINYTFLNPHLTLRLKWFDDPEVVIERTASEWRKWLPTSPTSPHWYQPEHLGRLIAAYVSHDEEHSISRTVRELVAQFRGLSGTAKQKAILASTGMERSPLASLVDVEEGELRMEAVGALLDAMKKHSKPVKPADLGVIGEGHLKKRVADSGGEMDFFSYKAVKEVDEDGLPYVVETAFAPLQSAFKIQNVFGERRRLVTGVNWSAGIINPFRTLGGIGNSLDSVLSQRCCGSHEPIVFVLHLAKPRVEYTDRGKSAVVL
jgi:DNA topoisomerase VI subunit B